MHGVWRVLVVGELNNRAHLDATLPTGFGLSTGHQSAISTPQRYNGALDHNPTQSYMFTTAARRLGDSSELI